MSFSSLFTPEVICAICVLMGGIASGFLWMVKWVARRLDEAEKECRKHLDKCGERVTTMENERHQDSLAVISKNTVQLAKTESVLREIAGATDRLAVAVAGLPEQRDPAETRRKLQRQVDDFSPHATPALEDRR